MLGTGGGSTPALGRRAGRVWQPTASEAVGRPAAIQVSEPVKELHARGGAFPCELPCGAVGRALESGEVGGLRCVCSRFVPRPLQAVWLSGEGDGLNCSPS